VIFVADAMGSFRGRASLVAPPFAFDTPVFASAQIAFASVCAPTSQVVPE
jgi:hypothetical protein